MKFGLGDQSAVECLNDGLRILAEGALGNCEWHTLAGVDVLPGIEIVFLIVGGEFAVEGDAVLDDIESFQLLWSEFYHEPYASVVDSMLDR